MMKKNRVRSPPSGTMEGTYRWLPLAACFVALIAVSMAATGGVSVDGAATYIVHMDKLHMPRAFSTHEHWYTSIVSSIEASSGIRNDQEQALLYTYHNVIHGFSAKLTQIEVDALEKIPGHIATHPDSSGKLHTTHSYKFLGLDESSGIWPKSGFGHDVIIAILDTGVWPESKSFVDDGMSEVPARWKGLCQPGTAFNSSVCNRKLIGARYFNKGFLARYGKIFPNYDYDSARDFDGHGSHTSSIAAGSYVPNVEYFGYAKGTARGMAPGARVAMYKVAWDGDVMQSDVLAGMDQAIADGADMLSLSLGFDPAPYYKDPISLGAFGAIERGVFVSCSAGNMGPAKSTMYNSAPWILTVGASTIDRDFAASVTLGNGAVFQGTSYFVEDVWLSRVPLLYFWESETARVCTIGSLDSKLVRGKIVLCMNSNYTSDFLQLAEAQRAGAAGAIIVCRELSLVDTYPDDFEMPVVLIKSTEGVLIANYATHSSNPTVDIKFQITVLGSKPAPAVADFSSRGPNRLSPGILKPDVVAPGVNIVAAWRPDVPIIKVGSHYLESDYNLVSGTSMSSPHAVAIAALVKAVHPEWSPAAIRSALMTTAYTLDNTNHTLTDLGSRSGSRATPLDFGAGHLNPNRAADPGLVYDLGVQDYVKFLCGLNYTSQQIRLVTKAEYSCSNGRLTAADLNYPSFIASFSKETTSSAKQVQVFRRILTNVGDSASVYKAMVEAPEGVNVDVKPDVLVFQEKHQKLSFLMRVEINGVVKEDEFVRYGYLSWVDGNDHVVKSPVVAIYE